MIKSVFDEKRNQYNVTISEEDLRKAFEAPNEKELNKLMHNIAESCYGKYVADKVFPLEGESDNE